MRKAEMKSSGETKKKSNSGKCEAQYFHLKKAMRKATQHEDTRVSPLLFKYTHT